MKQQSGRHFKTGFLVACPSFFYNVGFSSKSDALIEVFASYYHKQVSHEILGQHPFSPGRLLLEDTEQSGRKEEATRLGSWVLDELSQPFSQWAKRHQPEPEDALRSYPKMVTY